MGILKVRVNNQWENAGFMPPASVVGDYVPLTGGAITGDLSTTGFMNAIGGVYAPAFRVTSASQLKQDINPVDANVVAAIIASLKPVTYRWQNNPEKLNYGFTVDDIERAVPGVVDDTQDVKHYDLIQIVALLAAEVQNLRTWVEELKRTKGRI